MSDWQSPCELPDLRRVGIIALDTETKDEGLLANRGSGWPAAQGHLCGVSLAHRADDGIRALYFPLRHPDSCNLDCEQVFQWLRDLIASGVRIVTQNGLYDWGWLRANAGIVMPPSDRLEEIGALATMVDENRYRYNLESLCAWRGLPGKDESLIKQAAIAYGFPKKAKPQAYLWQLPARFVGSYAEADVANTLALFESLDPILDQEGTRAAYRLEVDLLPMVLEMRRRGIRVDTAAAECAREQLLQKRDAVFAELSEKLGIGVGMTEIGRTKWRAQTFDQHGIAYPRTAKGNPSFTAGSAGWMHKHPHWLPRLIVKADKYNNAAVNFLETYILGHVVRLGSVSRVHAEIHPHRSDDGGTRSLRFSYSNPPLQLMPAHDEELAPLIRGVFLPEEGELWAKPDVSQQEFRFIVHYAAHHKLPKAAEAVERYCNNPETDFHNLVVALTGLDRQSAKAVNFAKSFGAGVRKFAAMIGKGEGEARAIYDRYDRELPFVSRLSQLCEQAAKRQGYLTLYDGARRHWESWAPDRIWQKGMGPCQWEEAIRRVNDPEHPWYRQAISRADTHKAMNALIQGSAARHSKLWMRACWREGIVPLLQMHDSLDCSVSSPKQAELVARLGCEAVKLEVPMLVDLKYGRNWGDAKHTWAELHGETEPANVIYILAPGAPAIAEPELAPICIHCRRDPPDGLECASTYDGAWLHPQCEAPFIQARMAEVGLAQQADILPPPRPLRGPGDGFDGFDSEPTLPPPPMLRPHSNGGARPTNQRYPHGEYAGPAAGPVTAEYIYISAAGQPHMRVVRRVDATGKKGFPTYHWAEGGWVLGWPKEVVPYRLPELLAAPADAAVLICEGEKDVNTAINHGFVATCNPGGAGKWQPELTQYFKGKQRVCIIEDNDAAGAKHTAIILKELRDVVPTIGVVRFPELKVGGDLTDFFEAGGNKPYLLSRIEAALKAGVARTYVIVLASEVELENISWIWPNHLAHGALELLTGDPDLGKSQIHMSYAACVTRGTQWPDGYPGSQPQRVLLVTAEDNYANTVGPRAVAAGVDLTALIYLKGLVRSGKHELFLLSSGLQELEQVLLDHDNIGLVLIDPITAYMGSPASGRFDSHRATDVRSVLGPLKDLAERRRTAISAITHPPKGAKASPLDSFIGSQAYIAAARIAHLCVPEAEPGLAGAVRNTGRVFFTQVKNNIGLKASTLAYHLDTKSIGFDRLGEPLKPAPYVVWDGAVDLTSAEALAQTRAVAKTKANPVHEFLRDILASGPVLQKIIVERGAAKGISLPQLRRARKAVGAVTFKRRGGNVISPWLWALPEYVPDDVEREDESAPEGGA